MEISVLVEKPEKLPDPLKKEVEDFIDFLMFKKESYLETLEVRDSAYHHKILSEDTSKKTNPSSGAEKAYLENS